MLSTLIFFVSRSGPKRKQLPISYRPWAKLGLKSNSSHSSTKLTLALKDMCAVKSDLFGCISVAEWLLASQSGGNIIFLRPCKTRRGLSGVLRHDRCQEVRLTAENLCSRAGRSVLAWLSVPFGSDVFTPSSACCWGWDAAGGEGDRCAAVTLNKLRNIMLPAAPARGGRVGKQKRLSMPEINGTDGLIWRRREEKK